MTTIPTLDEESTGADAVLDSLRALRAEEIRREQAMVLLAVEWVRTNPCDPKDVRFFESAAWEELAALGCPMIDELSLPTFAEASGMTENRARRLVGESVMLVYLLPKVWERVRCGQLEVWRARKLAEACRDLSPEAIAYIDRNMSLSTARHTERGREGLIAEAMARFMPEEVAEQEAQAQDQRGIDLDWEELGSTGTVSVVGALDLPDALDLEAAISAGAQALKELGSDAPLDLRRSWALGDLARSACLPRETQVLDPELAEGALRGRGAFFHPDCACQRGIAPERPVWDGRGAPPTKVKMFIHLTPAALAADGEPPGVGTAPPGGAAAEERSGDEGTAVPTTGFAPVRVEGTGILAGMVLTPGTVRDWFLRPTALAGPKLTIRPVIDLAEHQHVEAYEVPERLKEQMALTTGGCVFPWCHRPARATDCDHTIPWKEDGTGGPTCTCNLAPLCRRHHRAKTHADNHVGNAYTWWNYESLGEGKYLWKGPKGSVLLRTNAGTYDVTPGHVSSGPRVPGQELPPLTTREALVSLRDDEVEDGPAAAAAQVAERIAQSLPAPSELSERHPADPGEEPYFKPRRRARPALAVDPWADQDGAPPPF